MALNSTVLDYITLLETTSCSSGPQHTVGIHSIVGLHNIAWDYFTLVGITLHCMELNRTLWNFIVSHGTTLSCIEKDRDV